MFILDTSTEFGARTERRLRDEEVIWLTAVNAGGTPQPNPVWFLWQDNAIIILSQPEAKKVQHIRAHPRVALNFNTSEDGNDVVVITGDAVIDIEPLSAPEYTAYMAKYRAGIESLQMTPESMARDYSVVIRIVPKHLRGF